MIPLSEWPPDPWLSPDASDQLGLVGVGGSLNPPLVLNAYRHGIFPWYNEGEPIAWWSPDPRAVFEMDGLHVSRRLARTIRSGTFAVTFDTCYRRVMEGCRVRLEGTWITPEMLAGYTALHRLGHAHSVEVWRGGELVGGLYGLALNAFFAAESMFHTADDASKVAMAALFERLRHRGFELVDTQMLTPHTQRMGAVLIPREEYLRRLGHALSREGVAF